MKVAITGGTGFLGKYVYDFLKSRGYIVTILSRFNDKLNHPNHRQTDYTIESLIDALYEIDAVVHLAAKRSNGKNILSFNDNNIITQNIYEACLKRSITNIVYASTISVYSGKELPWTEKQVPNPGSMYGVSKLSGEHISNIYNKEYGLKIKKLRLAHLYGFNELNNYMINLFMRTAFNKQKITIDTPSFARREFLYAKDAAKGIYLALNHKDSRETINLGSGEAYTNLEVAKIINEAFNNHGNLFVKNDGEERIYSSYMDNSLAGKIYGFKPDYNFKSALIEIHNLMGDLENVPIRV